MALMDINLTGTSFTDYHLVNVGAGVFQLSHDWFTKEDLIIRTAPAWGGTLLIEGTDYTLGTKSNELSARVSAAGPERQVFHEITIINATYQTGDLYFSGKYIADSNAAADINALADGLVAHVALTGSSAHGAVSAPTASQIITRDAAGRAQVVAPSAAADIARKDTVDAVQTNLTTHAALTNPHSATAAPTADRLVLRDAAGRAQIVAPSVAADIVNKGTLDTHAALTGSSAHGAVSAPTPSQLVTRDAAGRAQVVAPSVDADITNKGWVRDFIYPVGSYYTQYPDAASNIDSIEFPTSQRPETLFGGTWAEQWPTESVYFRTSGTLSDTGRASGKQEDQFQDWQLGASADSAGARDYWGRALNRDYWLSMATGATYCSLNICTVQQGGANKLKAMNDGTNGTPRTGAETRVVNRRIKVWKRTA